MEFIRVNSLNIKINEAQAKNLSNESKIKKMLQEKNVLGFDIYCDKQLIGFAMLKEFEKHKYFLWDYYIDYDYQNKGFGTKALQELIDMLKKNYHCNVVTTTYKFGNLPAKRLYEKIGFIETDIVDEEEVHEVNMRLDL